MYKLYNGDCLEIMKSIEEKSIDCVICDLPYGTTNCKWDSVLDITELWNQYKRIIIDNAMIILFANEPYKSYLITSNMIFKFYKNI